jgi:hypothetical protein
MSEFLQRHFEQPEAVAVEIRTALEVGDMRDIAATIGEVAGMVPLPWEDAVQGILDDVVPRPYRDILYTMMSD